MASNVLVWIEQEDGQADPIAWQAMAAAAKVAGDLGGSLTAVVFGDQVGDIARQAIEAGADRVYTTEDASLVRYRVEPYAKLLARILENEPPSVILAGASTAGLELTAYVAALTDAGLAPDCTDLHIEGDQLVAVRPALVGNLVSTVKFTGTGHRIVTVRRNVFQPADRDESRTGEAAHPAEQAEEESQPGESVETRTASRLTSKIIVSGGRGVGGRGLSARTGTGLTPGARSARAGPRWTPDGFPMSTRSARPVRRFSRTCTLRAGSPARYNTWRA